MDLLTLGYYYNQPHRNYHNLDHIQQMLQAYGDIFGDGSLDHLSDLEIQIDRWAIQYHDIVYLPWAEPGANESNSAMMFRHHATQLYPHPDLTQEVIEKVCAIIIDTADHTTCHEFSDRVIDCDLSILGSTSLEYAKYVAKTRAEYSMATDEEWKEGRSKFLNRMLAQKRVFKTESAHYMMGESAKYNLKNELRQLQG